MKAVVIGAGMAGIAAAIKWRAAGLGEVAVYEKAEGPGGTWRDNTYPGVSCDVPSHLYSYSFAPNPEWTTTFSPGAEIRDYLAAVARQYGVTDLITYGVEVVELTYGDGRWRVGLADGRTDEADVVIAATGVLHHPSYPDIEGLSTFAGAVFHTARWDHTVPLIGARVGVVGIGSSGVQVVGALVDTVGELKLFQRTAQWIVPVPNPPIPDEDRARYRADPDALRSLRADLAITFIEGFANAVVDADSPALKRLEDVCRANLESSVMDPDLRERLRPNYRAACKRLVVSPNFYRAIQQPNAHLVTEPIERVGPAGLYTTDGEVHELDVIVLATGFRVDRFLRPMKVSGRDGVQLDDAWAERPSAYLSVSVPDFPNLFMVNGPNGPVGNFSLIDVAEIQLDYILDLVAKTSSGGRLEVSASPAAAERFERDRVEAARRTVWVTGCRSWYLDDRGIPAVWPWTMTRFRELMAAPDLSDYEVRS